MQVISRKFFVELQNRLAPVAIKSCLLQMQLLDATIDADYHSYMNPHPRGGMKTIQMTLDRDLVKAVDRAAKKLKTSRSAFTRQALREALRRRSTEDLERRHREGYSQRPVAANEFSVWEDEQAWGDE